MFPLKPVSPAGVPAARQKAERYRLLGEPTAAESICLDVLAVEPENQQAAITPRWNTCARILERGADHVRPRVEQEYEPSLE